MVHDTAKPWERRSPERLGINSVDIWYGVTHGPRCGEALGPPFSRTARYVNGRGIMAVGTGSLCGPQPP